MRNVLNINQKWYFTKNSTDIGAIGEEINLPHTWNATDGQDGGNDYFRGSSVYKKKIIKAEMPEAECYFVEICGANSSADVYANGDHLFRHDGGYSKFRVDISDYLIAGDVDLAIVVDNSQNETVYPQMADFTFYGGIYRDVNVIATSNKHFDLDYYGSQGVMVTPKIKGNDAKLEIRAFSNKNPEDKLVYTVYDAEKNVVSKVETTAEQIDVILHIPFI